MKARRYYTERVDGLTRPWRGRLWLNPPWSAPHCGRFVDRLLSEIAAGNVTEAILLVHLQSDRGWCQRALASAGAYALPRGRLMFTTPEGKRHASHLGCVIFYFGSRPSRFAEGFAEFGHVTVGRTIGNDRCAHCDANYVAVRSTARYCSSTCRSRARAVGPKR